MYKVFVRNWWKVNQEWPNGLEPDSNARKTTIGHADSEDEAREMAQNYNATHKEGKLSRKAEFTRS
jgi:hypothetical protein|tara:strand:+ start:2275 stop:2472 length:198 start_codon:yes stop_codon:yes gene_type:complete